VRAAVEAKLAGLMRVTGGMGKPAQGKQLVIALVGPTGVGKTTTIAKLAAVYKLRLGHSVGLVTSDTYRIAAVEQLRTYATIIGVPLQVAATPDEVRSSVKALDQCAVVLVDTAGRGPRDARRLDELAACVEAAKPSETHMVLSASAAPEALSHAAERFSIMKPDRWIVTKIDESSGLGWLPELAQQVGLPISYVTTGQEVPDDLALAQPQRLARMILDGLQEGASRG
jgi:flagellar biosynthesis protein FlhF